jgi:hypothetical protein
VEVGVGDPREVILQRVQGICSLLFVKTLTRVEHNADYLFVGRRGQGLLKRALLGSVSDYLIRHCGTASVSLFHDGGRVRRSMKTLDTHVKCGPRSRPTPHRGLQEDRAACRQQFNLCYGYMRNAFVWLHFCATLTYTKSLKSDTAVIENEVCCLRL